MLQVVVQKGNRQLLLTQLKDDDSMTEAIAIALGAMTNNSKFQKAFVYIKNNGNKPVRIKTIGRTLFGKIKVR